MNFTAQQIAAFLQGEIVGDPNASVNTFAKIEEGTPGALSFLSNPKYESFIYETKSSIVLVNKEFTPEKPIEATLVKVDNAYESLAKLLALYESMQPKPSGIDSLAYVAPTAKIGKDVYLAPFSYVGNNAEIGDGTQVYPHVFIGDGAKVGSKTILYSNVNIYHGCKVGSNCILHSGCVIGADGFGHAPSPQGYEKIPQIGIAIVEDNVEIGANTCVDRATMGATIVHAGAKLDNLIQVAHNAEIGSHTVMAAQTGVAGSTKVGEWCMFGGQVGIAGHIKVADHTSAGAKTGINNHVRKAGAVLMGTHSMDAKQYMKVYAAQKQVPELLVQVRELQKRIEELEQKLK